MKNLETLNEKKRFEIHIDTKSKAPNDFGTDSA